MSIGGSIRRTIYRFVDYFQANSVMQHYADIRRILEQDDHNLQIKYLHELLGHATQNSIFYRSFKDAGIDQFPVVNKEFLRRHFEIISVKPQCIPKHKGKIHIQRTSGSTGEPFAVPQDRRKRARRVAELKYFGTLAGYRSHEKMAQLRIWTRWHSKPKFQAFWENIYPVDGSKMDDHRILELTRFLNRKRVVALWGYASWFDTLAGIVEKYAIKIKSLKVIIAGSEMLNPNTRQRLEYQLKCRVISRYSSEELGVLGQDDELEGPFFLNDAGYFFEFLKMDSNVEANPGELSRIVVTDLFNYAFPMIRYDTGDTGTFAWTVIRGHQVRVLEKIYGRQTDLVYDTQQVPVHPMVLARILKNYDEILLWQFVQKSADSYELNLKLKSGFDTFVFIEPLLKVFGKDAQIRITEVDDIPVLASGKRKSVVNEWKR